LQKSSALISEGYRELQQQLHDTGKYGGVAAYYAGLVNQILTRLEVTHLLDYGCGSKVELSKHIKTNQKLTYQAYDPGVREYAGDPVPAQLVCCIDVLEHIEPERLDDVLDHLASLTEVAAFLTIHIGPAQKVLADGRNAHLIQKPVDWWLPKLMQRFDVQTMQVTMPGKAFYVICHPKTQLEAVDGSKLTQ
jgi:hypothetical protein